MLHLFDDILKGPSLIAENMSLRESYTDMIRDRWISSSLSWRLQDQVLQEVQNFAILSALAMSLGLAAVLVVDGSDHWTGSYR
jgi:hypothetical protein